MKRSKNYSTPKNVQLTDIIFTTKKGHSNVLNRDTIEIIATYPFLNKHGEQMECIAAATEYSEQEISERMKNNLLGAIKKQMTEYYATPR